MNKLKTKISEIFVKWNLPTRQKAINEIVEVAVEYANREETFYSTIIGSDIWKEWIALQEKEMKFDVWESTECNMLSARHFEEFIKWVENRKLREEYKINWKDLKDK